MPRIRCHYIDCSFLDDGHCSAAAVEIDPNEGCMTYSPTSDILPDDDWEDDSDELEEWEDIEEEEEDEEDLWLDEGDDY
jgi:hypothetical protein